MAIPMIIRPAAAAAAFQVPRISILAFPSDLSPVPSPAIRSGEEAPSLPLLSHCDERSLARVARPTSFAKVVTSTSGRKYPSVQPVPYGRNVAFLPKDPHRAPDARAKPSKDW